jgi:hypothetical protein
VGRPFASVRIMTVLLTALLAWPWNVVLSAAESSQIAIQGRLGTLDVHGNLRVGRIVRHGWWNQPSCSVIAPDYDRDEQEGDDGGPFSISTVSTSIQVLSCEDPAAFADLSLVLPVRSIPREHLCRLRC